MLPWEAITTVWLVTDNCVCRHEPHTQNNLFEKPAYPPWPTDPKTGDSSFLSHSWWPSALPTSYYNYYERLAPGFGTDLSMSNIITLLCTIAACSDERHHRLLHPQFIIYCQHTQQSDIISPYWAFYGRADCWYYPHFSSMKKKTAILCVSLLEQ